MAISSFVFATAASTSATTSLTLTIPDAGDGAAVGDICLAMIYLGTSSSATGFASAPAGWQHAYSSPAAVEIAAATEWQHAIFMWKILEAADLGASAQFTRVHSTGDSMRGDLSVWHNADGFDPANPFDTMAYRATGLLSQSASQLGKIDVNITGDIACMWACVPILTGGNWSVAGGWTRVRLSAGGTDGGFDSQYQTESGGQSASNCNYAYLTNNKWIHWAWTFAPLNLLDIQSPTVGGPDVDVTRDWGQDGVVLIAPEQPVVQVVSYQTDVMRAWDGTEQRVARRVNARQSIEAVYLLEDEAVIRGLQRDLFARKDEQWYVPAWWEARRITSDVADTDYTWTVDLTLSDIAAGDYIYVESAIGDHARIYEVESVTAEGLTTVSAANEAFPAGSYLWPIWTTRLVDPTSIERAPYGPCAARLVYERVAVPSVGAYSQVETYAGLAVLGHQPSARGGGQRRAYDQAIQRMDFGGVFQDATEVARSFIEEPRTYVIRGIEEYASWKAFLAAVVGRREPFYAPTFRDDLELSEAPSIGSSTIRIVDNGYQSRYNPYASHNHLRLATAAGDFYVEVTSIVDNGDTQDLTISPALPATTDGSTISQISFLEQCRLGSDDIRFEHRSGYSTVNITLVVVQQ